MCKATFGIVRNVLVSNITLEDGRIAKWLGEEQLRRGDYVRVFADVIIEKVAKDEVDSITSVRLGEKGES